MFRQTIDSDPVVQAGAGCGRGAFPAGAERRTRRPRACSTATGSTNTSTTATPAPPCSARSTWSLTDRLRLLPGLRFNYDQKDVDFDQQVYGGLQTTDPALIALQLSILAPQTYQADVDDTNLSGQISAAYRISRGAQRLRDLRDRLQVGRPQPERRADRRGEPAGDRGGHGQTRRRAQHRSRPEDRASARRDRQPHGLRHRDRGLPDAGDQRQRRRAARIPGQCGEGARPRRGARRKRASATPTCRSMALSPIPTAVRSFPDAPPPLEETGGPQFKDISGSVLPGISKWALSIGGEYASRAVAVRTRRAVVRRRRRQLPLVLLVERELFAVLWSSTATPWSTRASVSARRMAGRFSSGRAICSTRTTSSCSPRRPATPASTSAAGRRANRRSDAAGGAQERMKEEGRREEERIFCFFFSSFLLPFTSSYCTMTGTSSKRWTGFGAPGCVASTEIVSV